jgi:hypothetical protein
MFVANDLIISGQHLLFLSKVQLRSFAETLEPQSLPTALINLLLNHLPVSLVTNTYPEIMGNVVALCLRIISCENLINEDQAGSLALIANTSASAMSTSGDSPDDTMLWGAKYAFIELLGYIRDILHDVDGMNTIIHCLLSTVSCKAHRIVLKIG